MKDGAIFGFVYIWRDRQTRMFYVGSHHGGHYDDGYVCGSLWMRREFKRRPSDFTRRILEINTVSSDRAVTLAMEGRWLQMIRRDELGSRYYNRMRLARGWAELTPDQKAARKLARKAVLDTFTQEKWQSIAAKRLSRMTPEKWAAAATKRLASEHPDARQKAARASLAAFTPERRKILSAMGVAARMATQTPEDRSRLAISGWKGMATSVRTAKLTSLREATAGSTWFTDHTGSTYRAAAPRSPLDTPGRPSGKHWFRTLGGETYQDYQPRSQHDHPGRGKIKRF